MASVSITQISLIALPSGAAAILVHGGLGYPAQVVVGLLRQEDDEDDRIVVGQSRDAVPGTFTIVFVEIPDGEYTIEIYESPGMLVGWRDVTVDSSTLSNVVAALKSKDSKSRVIVFLTVIKSPGADGATVQQDCLGAGTASSTSLPTGTMTPQDGSAVVNGVRPSNSHSIWTLEFPNLQFSGPLYDMHVDVAGSGGADIKNLKVI